MTVRRRLLLIGIGGTFLIWSGMASAIWFLQPSVWRPGWVELIGAGMSLILAARMAGTAQAAGSPEAGWFAAVGLWTGLSFAFINRRLVSMRGMRYPADWAAQDAVVPLVCGTVTLIVALAAHRLLLGKENCSQPPTRGEPPSGASGG